MQKNRYGRQILVLLILSTALLSGCGRKTVVQPQEVPDLTEEEYTFPTVAPGDVTFQDAEVMIGGPGSSLTNILLIGQDQGTERPGDTEYARADVLILCSFQRETKQLVMTSFQRDLYVEIPGSGPDRINRAYELGGMPLLRKTLQKNFGILVDACVEVDFDRFPAIVDALGGVTLEITDEEAREINRLITYKTVEPGYAKLDGAQALVYCRIRKIDNDYVRTQRQQKLLEALLQQGKNMTLMKAVKAAGTLIPMVRSDMGFGQLVDLTWTLFPMAREFTLSHQQIPITDTYEECIISDKWVYRIDFPANRKFLYDTLCLGLDLS